VGGRTKFEVLSKAIPILPYDKLESCTGFFVRNFLDERISQGNAEFAKLFRKKFVQKQYLWRSVNIAILNAPD
jgi:hypothetical protein